MPFLSIFHMYLWIVISYWVTGEHTLQLSDTTDKDNAISSPAGLGLVILPHEQQSICSLVFLLGTRAPAHTNGLPQVWASLHSNKDIFYPLGT